MTIYFKSFVQSNNEPVTTTYNPEEGTRTTCQTLSEAITTRTLKPNTTHSQLEKRLCASLINPGYQGTYRPEGIVFETVDEPSYVAPFDIMALTTAEKFTSADYQAKLIPGHEKFLYKTIEDMLAAHPSSKKAIRDLNRLRKEQGLEEINSKTMQYNECCFTKDIHVKPVALIGGTAYQEIGDKYNIPVFNTFHEYQKHTAPKIGDFTRKSIVGAIYRVGSSFAIDASIYLGLTGGKLSEFFERFQLDKFLTVTAAVVAINYVDYKFDITNKLDNVAKNVINAITQSVKNYFGRTNATTL